MSNGVRFQALPNIPEITCGDNLSAIIGAALAEAGLTLTETSIVVVAQKIVSKAEGRLVNLTSVSPSPRARELAKITGKDPRMVELVLSESSAVLRAVPGVMIVRHRLGYVMANAGIDQSNLPGNEQSDQALLLPLNPTASARELHSGLAVGHGPRPGIIISDSFGRPWRNGAVNIALASAGIPALIDQRNGKDRHGRVLQHTLVAFADAVAAGAGLVMGEAGEGTPVALVDGLRPSAPLVDATALLRPAESDLFQ
ncbi:Coenzyme F420:L-glutamate ligase [compost metagenome]